MSPELRKRVFAAISLIFIFIQYDLSFSPYFWSMCFTNCTFSIDHHGRSAGGVMFSNLQPKVQTTERSNTSPHMQVSFR